MTKLSDALQNRKDRHLKASDITAIRALEQRTEEAERERDEALAERAEWLRRIVALSPDPDASCPSAVLDELRHRGEELAEALRPFAAFGNQQLHVDDDFQYFPLNNVAPITAGDFRLASSALASHNKEAS